MRRAALATAVAAITLLSTACTYDVPTLPGDTGGGGTSPCSDSPCTGCDANQQCDASLGCVQCLVDEQCDGGRVCDRGKCRACAVEEDGTDTCAASGRGQPAACAGGECRPACSGDAECAPFDGTQCRDGRCVECRVTTHCSDDRVCDEQRGVCVLCVSDADCPGATPRCSPDFECVACLVADDCPQPGRCEDGTCVSACCEDADCEGSQDGPVCDASSGKCMACLGAEHCVNGGTCSADGACVCNDQFPCTEPAVCSNGTCVTD